MATPHPCHSVSRHVIHRSLPAALLLLLVALPLGAIAIEFQDVSAGAGLSSRTESYGASWGDINNDGYPDLFANNHRTPPSMYLNRGNGTFVNVRSQIQPFVYRPTADTHGGTFMDFDNDGDEDFLLTAGSGNPSQFLVNQGGELIERGEAFGLALTSVAGRTPVWIDVNKDRLLDVLIVNRAGTGWMMLRDGNRFVPRAGSTGMACTKFQYGQMLHVDGDSDADLLCSGQEAGAENRFPQFAYDVTRVPFANLSSAMVQVSKTVDTAIADFDGDLRPDIFHLRGTPRPSGAVQVGRTVEALLTGGTKSFSFATSGVLSVTIHWNQAEEGEDIDNIKIGARGFKPASSQFELDPADPRVAGTPSYSPSEVPVITIGYSPSTQTWTFTNVNGTAFSNAYFIVRSSADVRDLRTQGMWAGDKTMAPVLLRNLPGGFVDRTSAAGVAAPIQCISAAAGDFDNDRDQDLYLVCRAGPANLANILYKNQGDGTFVRVANAGGAAGPVGAAITQNAGAGDSVVMADFDVDGFLDLYVTNGYNMRPKEIGGPEKLYRNTGNSNHWIQLDLIGVNSVRDALGARVIATAGGEQQTRVADGGYHRWSQHDKRLHFGLGAAQRVDLRIEWPSGRVDEYESVVADRLYQVREGGGITQRQPGEGVPYPCGIPDLDRGNKRGVFLWKDCLMQTWKVRALATTSAVTYSGVIDADRAFTSVEPQGIEAGDTVNNSNSTRIAFELAVDENSRDGFDFTMPAGARGCINLQQPAGETVRFGVLEQPISGRFDVQTGQPCGSSLPSLSVSASSAAEDSGTLNIAVRLSAVSSTPVEVTLRSADGTATAGDDYTAIDQRLTFAPGERTKNVAVTLRDDSLTEGSETFTVSLSNPTNASIGIATATASILDDEGGVVCGAPTFDPATETGMFLWQDCGTSQWHARVSAGGGSELRYSGTMAASAAFTSVRPFSIEASDVLDYTTNPARIEYGLRVSTKWLDGFDFVPSSSSAVCVNATLPGAAQIYVGSTKRAVAPPFDLASLGVCETP